MDTIQIGSLVKCIKENNNDTTVPETVLGEIYTVISFNLFNWVRLKNTNPPYDRFKFDIDRFKLCKNIEELYPTINKEYFKQ